MENKNHIKKTLVCIGAMTAMVLSCSLFAGELSPVAAKALAKKYAISVQTVNSLYQAIDAGRGSQAQFNLSELGGMGQWSSGGMVMIGDMFNSSLKAKVISLASDLATIYRDGGHGSAISSCDSCGGAQAIASVAPMGGGDSFMNFPSMSGGQNGLSYEYYPGKAELLVTLRDGQRYLYSTKGMEITGVSQKTDALGSALLLQLNNGTQYVLQVR
ncbi:MAG: hypothetical protein HQK50_00790 [Oligoflexia bacterium]|nr:hypothetical protein [Oligoflexia bacterium]MBF0364072.1 hypothetical protein [Oligoflexia bacterium]